MKTIRSKISPLASIKLRSFNYSWVVLIKDNNCFNVPAYLGGCLSLKKTSRGYPASRFVSSMLWFGGLTVIESRMFSNLKNLLIFVGWLLTGVCLFCSRQKETLIAIKAPHGTTLEVPDPDEVNLVQRMYFDLKKRKEKKSEAWVMTCFWSVVPWPLQGEDGA